MFNDMAATGGGSYNHAFCFLKPHAVTAQSEWLVRGYCAAKGIEVMRCVALAAEQIDAQGLVDQHYGVLATHAMHTLPAALPVSAAKAAAFAAAFDVEWGAAVAAGDAMNCAQAGAADLGGCDARECERLWRAGTVLKLAPGLYISGFASPVDAARTIFVVNGFYASMRAQFTKPGEKLLVLELRWAEPGGAGGGGPSWAAFRQECVGATDPASAAPGSLRGLALAQWEALGLAAPPKGAENFLHASAGPAEAAAERRIWLGTAEADDPLLGRCAEGSALLGVLRRWCANEVDEIGGKTGPAFDALEEVDTSTMLALATEAALRATGDT
jgi:hypothetical protein